MGCSPSREESEEDNTKSKGAPQDPPTDPKPKKRTAVDVRFRGAKMEEAYETRSVAFMNRMDAQKLPYLTRRGLLLGFVETKQWRIYLYFDDWPVPVTSKIVDNLVAQYRRALSLWMQALLGFKGYPSSAPKVKLFGFVFRKGVTVDASFEAKYRKYPVVREWTETGEASPWKLQLADGTSFSPQNFYRKDIRLCDLRVVGNRTETGAKFYPETWDGYKHPEGIDGFETRYWHGSKGWNAVAQQHYLRVGGIVKDYPKGDFGAHFHVLQHEMGHCFFLDDMYDTTKYPRRLKACGCSLDAQDTIMHSATELTPFDSAMLRHVWLKQVELQKKETAAAEKNKECEECETV